MSGSNVRSAVRRNDLQAITAVGGVRAHRIRRDTECDTIYEIANASLAELQQVWSVGPHFACVIKGSAQGLIKRAKSEAERTVDTDERVAVVVPSPYEGIDRDNDIYSVLDEAGLETDEQMDLITECVRDAGVSLRRDDIRILAAEDSTNVINWWHEQRAREISFRGTGENTVEFQEVDTPWDKYVDDVNYKAAQDRNEELVRRANKVVIVCEGPYTDNLLDEIERQSTEHGGAVECHAQYTFDPSRPESGLLDWDPAEETEYDVRTYDVSDAETYGRPSSTYTGPGSYETRVKVTVDGPSGETEHDIGWLNDMNVDVEVGNTFEFSGAEWTIIGMKEVPVDDSESEQSDPDGLNIEETESSADVERDDDDSVPDVAGPLPDDRGEPAREGSVPELEPDGEREHLTQEPAASIDENSRIDENDLEDGDPGGGKVDEYVETSGLS